MSTQNIKKRALGRPVDRSGPSVNRTGLRSSSIRVGNSYCTCCSAGRGGGPSRPKRAIGARSSWCARPHASRGTPKQRRTKRYLIRFYISLFFANALKGLSKYDVFRATKMTDACVYRKKKIKCKQYTIENILTKYDTNSLHGTECYYTRKRPFITLVFRTPRRTITMEELKQPGEEGFIRQPLPDRDYDLSPLDSSKSSIHVLVDDVMIRILEHLPAKERILCEIVCRRWQAIVYGTFKRITHLNLDQFNPRKNGLQEVCQFRLSLATVSKMLIFTGETLKYLSLASTNIIAGTAEVYYNGKGEKLFSIIAKLSPNLEYLNLSNAPELDFDHLKALKDCINIKQFSAKNCARFNDDSVKELISVLPCLEKLYVDSSPIMGDCFNILPEELKELSINYCPVSKENWHKLSKTCRKLEVLEIEGSFNYDNAFLKELGVNCKKLINLNINQGIIRGYFQEGIEHIIKGCPDIKHIKCKYVQLDLKFVTNVNKIMKNRSEPIKISLNEGALTTGELLEANYDSEKIDFNFDPHSSSDEFDEWLDSVDSEEDAMECSE
ncbi:unnamed protein product [Meganyctiphanes norvegica]|uniref:F-box domain-containing protein n=1 Tax=Meganyctiphanes norvegica TaxID=48144 RepID=A0AAV2R673_MEGNR